MALRLRDLVRQMCVAKLTTEELIDWNSCNFVRRHFCGRHIRWVIDSTSAVMLVSS